MSGKRKPPPHLPNVKEIDGKGTHRATKRVPDLKEKILDDEIRRRNRKKNDPKWGGVIVCPKSQMRT